MSSVRFPSLTIASVFAAAALWSCNKNSAPEPEQTSPQAQEETESPMPAAGGGMMQELRAGCPMLVEGGVAMTFTEHPRRFVVEPAESFLAKAARALELLWQEMPECCKAHVVPGLEGVAHGS